MSVQTCFFYNDGGNWTKENFRLRVGVFRRKDETYLLDEWIVIDAKRHSKSKTRDCELKNIPDPVQVQEGDRIAVRVNKQCNKKMPAAAKSEGLWINFSLLYPVLCGYHSSEPGYSN